MDREERVAKSRERREAREERAERKRERKRERREAREERQERYRGEKVCKYCGTGTRGRHRVCSGCKEPERKYDEGGYYDSGRDNLRDYVGFLQEKYKQMKKISLYYDGMRRMIRQKYNLTRKDFGNVLDYHQYYMRKMELLSYLQNRCSMETLIAIKNCNDKLNKIQESCGSNDRWIGAFCYRMGTKRYYEILIEEKNKFTHLANNIRDISVKYDEELSNMLFEELEVD